MVSATSTFCQELLASGRVYVYLKSLLDTYFCHGWRKMGSQTERVDLLTEDNYRDNFSRGRRYCSISCPIHQWKLKWNRLLRTFRRVQLLAISTVYPVEGATQVIGSQCSGLWPAMHVQVLFPPFPNIFSSVSDLTRATVAVCGFQWSSPCK